MNFNFVFRAQFHVENAEMNMLHGSDSPANAENELRAFFEMDQTLAVIKPEAYEQQGNIYLNYLNTT